MFLKSKTQSGRFFGMELIKQYTSIRALAILFLLLNLGVKFFGITSTPPAATYDEMIYVAEAQSIVKYGTDLTGDWRPWHLEPSDAFYTELTSTVLTPGFLLFPENPILAAKFVPLLLGSLIPILLAFIAYKIQKSKHVFIFTAIVASLNPWIFQFSRMGYDSLFSIGFYLIGLVFILYCKEYKKLYSLIPLFLGFFQYQGHKPLLVPLVGICFLYLLFEKYSVSDLHKKFKKIIQDKTIVSVFSVLVFSVALTAFYLIRLPNLTSGERISEFSFYNSDELAAEVNESRRIALDSSVSSVFVNKYSVLGIELTERFLHTFNPKILFISGNKAVDTFAVLDYGYFHVIDIAVIVAALIFFQKRKKNYLGISFVLLFILIGTVPNVIRTGLPWIIFRGAFAFLGLILLMGIGGGNALLQIHKKLRIPVVAVYVLLTAPFFFTYFVRYPVTHTNNIGFYERLVANYIHRVGLDQKILVVPDRADASFNYQIAYGLLLTNQNRAQVQTSAQTKEFEINNTVLASNCPRTISEIPESTVVFVNLFKKPCEPQHDPAMTTEIKSLIDSGTIFTVYNDTLCSEYDLGSYPNVRKNVFAIEDLSNEEFCKTFFSR